ncbi:MAG TPA: ribosome small subunit-dependent GTPase A [Cyclobacteriaceae bacterium]|nr:ribosome small subunit-dependent GTPase A [Cyclobacteriaceae bacterium]
MISLENFGWSFYPSHYKNNSNTELKTGRVTSIKGFKYFVVSEKGECETELSGKLLYGIEQENLPKVGDWVLFMAYDSMGYIIEVLPRINELSRKSPGNKTQKQVLATNIDFAFVVQGLDRDFNIMRLDRYLVQLKACNINPVIILNKADLVSDQDEYRNEVLKLQRDCPLYFCSTYTGFGLEQLKKQALEKNRTYILIGSSGVGKSSLLNALIDKDVQHIAGTSASTHKGKHTTTTRELFQLDNGSLIIDTPGMREFGVTFEDGQDSYDLFPAIRQFAPQCRFADCKHVNETGCAVLTALDNGELDEEVYGSYLKLMKEQRRFEIRVEDKKRINRQFGKMTKEAKSHRKKYKY